MSCILDDPEIRGAALPLTVAQYHHLSAQGIVPERTELLQGVIIECMTKSPLHTFLVQRLARWLEPAVTAARFLRKEEPLTLANSEPEPDIAVVSGCPDDYRTAHPATAAFVVEVAMTGRRQRCMPPPTFRSIGLSFQRRRPLKSSAVPAPAATGRD